MESKKVSTFYQLNPDSLYSALIKKDRTAVSQFLEKGEIIPEFIYMQVTNLDYLSHLQFLLSFQPEKQSYALKLSFSQGAVECFQYLKAMSSQGDLEELKSINPRRNVEVIKNALNGALEADSLLATTDTTFSV